MYCVYVLTSVVCPERIYIGLTDDVERRLKQHNRGDSGYSKRYVPWQLEVQMVFLNKKIAQDFEKYLKSGSGFAFLKKHFLNADKFV